MLRSTSIPELPEMRELTEVEQAIMLITLGNPGKRIESIHYEVDEAGWRVCITKFAYSEYYDNWTSEMTSAFNVALWEADWALRKQQGVV